MRALTTIQVYYWMPDYRHILQEFMWQTMDVSPEFPRMNKFLHYWEHNIEGPIHDVIIAQADEGPNQGAINSWYMNYEMRYN